jgi:alanine racemase
MYLLNFLRRYRDRFDDPSKHLLRIEISADALRHNIGRFRTLYPYHHLAAVLKSNAYGHGLKEIGRFLDKQEGVECFVVDSIIEAQTLRDVGTRKPIIILGYVSRAALKSLEKIKKAIFVVNSKEQAELLQVLIDFKLQVHLKVDTGMNRQGIGVSELPHVINVLRSNKKILIGGMLSHLADADGPSGAATQEQIRRWKIALQMYKKLVPKSSRHIFHFAATAGARHLSTAESNLIRAGIGLYGFDMTQDKQLKVKPALSFWAKIVNIKEVKAGEKIGYNFTFTASKDMKIAVIPCGYYEGVPRSLSNKGKFYFNGNSLPILGRVSMNLTVVDISDVKVPIHLEDEVEVYSTDARKDNSVENVAKLCDTIPYEILVRLAPTIKRTIK